VLDETVLCSCLTLDAHCCHTGTAIKHPVPDRVKWSFAIFDIWALWRWRQSVRVPGCELDWESDDCEITLSGFWKDIWLTLL